jgi:hypothetical protein
MATGFITEELNIGDNLEELIETGFNMNELDDINIYYSYPYFSDDTYDYQYRLFIDNGEFILEDIKSDETDMETDSSVVVINTYPRCDLKKGLDIISNNYDFRHLDNNECITISSDMINYDSSDDIENNKKIVLLELYKTIF